MNKFCLYQPLSLSPRLNPEVNYSLQPFSDSSVLTKSTSPQLLHSQDLGQLSRLRRSGNDQQYKRLLAQLRCNQNVMLDYRSRVILVKGDHMQISFKLPWIGRRLTTCSREPFGQVSTFRTRLLHLLWPPNSPAVLLYTLTMSHE